MKKKKKKKKRFVTDIILSRLFNYELCKSANYLDTANIIPKLEKKDNKQTIFQSVKEIWSEQEIAIWNIQLCIITSKLEKKDYYSLKYIKSD